MSNNASLELMSYGWYRFCVFLIFLVMGFLFYDWIRRKIYLSKGKMQQLEKSNSKNISGIIFGKLGMFGFDKYIYSNTNSEGHIAVFGRSGLGKTTALLVPTLQSWNGTSFVIDISGDICKNIEKENKLVYEPADKNSIPYNIFGVIDRIVDIDEQNEALAQFGFLLMPDDSNMSDASRFFQTEGRKILISSLIAFYHQNKDFIEICEKIVGSSWKSLFNDIDMTNNEKAILYINSFEGASEQNTAGCKQSVDSVLTLFATNEIIKKSIRRPNESESSFEPAMIEKYNFFVVIEDTKLKLYAPLLNIITAQSLEFFSNRSNDSKNTILFCLDEMASFGRLEILDALRKLRKKRIRIMILTQSMADIDLIYGKEERMAMMNNFGFKVVLGADDTDTQLYFANLIGKENKSKNSVSKNSNSTTYTESETKEYAIEPAELARLGEYLILLHPDGFIKLKKNYFYK